MKSHRKSGFSLVEALVATILAAGGIAALMSAIGSSERAEARLLQKERMQRLANQKLEEIIATQDFGATSGDFSDQNEPDLAWEFVEESTSTENLEFLTVTVTSNSDETRVQKISKLLYRPPTSTGSAQP